MAGPAALRALAWCTSPATGMACLAGGGALVVGVGIYKIASLQSNKKDDHSEDWNMVPRPIIDSTKRKVYRAFPEGPMTACSDVILETPAVGCCNGGELAAFQGVALTFEHAQTECNRMDRSEVCDVEMLTHHYHLDGWCSAQWIWTNENCDDVEAIANEYWPDEAQNVVTNPRSWDNGTYFVEYEHDVYQSANDVYPLMIGVAVGFVAMAIINVLFMMMRRRTRRESKDPVIENAEVAPNGVHRPRGITDVVADEGAMDQASIQEAEAEEEEEEEAVTRSSMNSSDTVVVQKRDASTVTLEVA